MTSSHFLRSDLSQTSKFQGKDVEATVAQGRTLLRGQNPHSTVEMTLKDNDKASRKHFRVRKSASPLSFRLTTANKNALFANDLDH